MTVACILCGCRIETPPDPILDDQRTAREMQAIGDRIGIHFDQFHKELTNLLWMNATQVFALDLFAHCSSGDARYNGAVDVVLQRAKDYIQKITPGQIPQRADGPRVQVSKNLEGWEKLG